MVRNEIALVGFSPFLGDFVFPHFEDVSMNCLHIDLAYALYSLYLCCANGVMKKNGHVIDDMILYHAHTWFAWSLVCKYYLWMRWHEWLQPHFTMKEDLAIWQHRHLAKVTSFYLSAHAMSSKNWLLFECCFVFLVSLVGYMKAEGTLKSCHILSIKNMVTTTSTTHHLPPPHGDDELASRTTLFKGGEMMQPDTSNRACLALHHTSSHHGHQR